MSVSITTVLANTDLSSKRVLEVVLENISASPIFIDPFSGLDSATTELFCVSAWVEEEKAIPNLKVIPAKTVIYFDSIEKAKVVDAYVVIVRAINNLLEATETDLFADRQEGPILLRRLGKVKLNQNTTFWRPELLQIITVPYVVANISNRQDLWD